MDQLLADQRLNISDELMSNNGRVRLVMQADGNLVLYRTDDGYPLWASNTWQKPVTYAIMQGDGNLVAYSAAGQPFWASNTDGHPGAYVILQDDGNLVVYAPDGTALWASSTVQWFGPRFVPGFRPSTNAPLFSNSTGWPAGTQLSISVLGLPPVTIDATKMGLCGGMSFLTRDIFESSTPQLRGRDSRRIPLALAQHILSRLLDSFDGGAVVSRWLSATQSLDHDTVIRGPGLFHQTINELPDIVAEIDAGRLCPIGVVLTQSFAPWAVFNNHVELVWGYEQHGSVLTLHTYDCNSPDKDDIMIELDISSPTPAKTISTNGSDNLDAPGTVRGFFQIPYQHRDPSPAYIDDATTAISTAPPPRMAVGSVATVRVAATNTGSTSWTFAGGYRLGSQAPQDNTTWGPGRVDLQTASVDPQQTATFIFQVTAPAAAGQYEFAWRTVREGITWFGVPSPMIPVVVGSDAGICEPLHQQAQSLAAQLADVQAELAAIDWSDPFVARREAAPLSAQARHLQQQLSAIEAQQVANGCAPG
jgi:hypothetical protein